MLSLEGSQTKAKEAPFPHEVQLTLLDANPTFQCLGIETKFFNTKFMILDVTMKH